MVAFRVYTSCEVVIISSLERRMTDYRILYLSISYYNTPRDTVISRNVYGHILSAYKAVTLKSEVKEYKYEYYHPVLIEVYKIDLNELKIEKLSEDNMTPPTETQIDTIKGMCSILGKSYNEPETTVIASAWIDFYMDKYHKKCDETLDKNKIPPTEKQLNFIKGICEFLEIDYKEPKTKGEATVWLNHFVPFYKRKCEENELEWEANHSELMNNYGDCGE